jgi:hypothetical protein
MRSVPTTRRRASPPEWMRDTVDVVVLAAVLLAMTLAALY